MKIERKKKAGCKYRDLTDGHKKEKKNLDSVQLKKPGSMRRAKI